MVPLSDVIRRVRSPFDEPSPRFLTDTEITDWVNDACRDVARRSEDLQTLSTQIPIIPSVPQYILPSNLIRVHRLEFIPQGSSFTYPLRASTYAELDQVWGSRQNIPSSYPSNYCLWGTPGGVGQDALSVRLYPVPAQPGILNLFYYRLPYRFLDPIANPTELPKLVEVPEGWDDLVVLFAVARAKMKDRDPTWKDEMESYESKIGDLVDMSRQWHDQQRTIMNQSATPVPGWLYGGGDW